MLGMLGGAVAAVTLKDLPAISRIGTRTARRRRKIGALASYFRGTSAPTSSGKPVAMPPFNVAISSAS